MMGKIGLAFRAFFKTLWSRETAERVEQLFRDQASPKLNAPSETKLQNATPAAKSPPPPARSEALTLLATLQREARLVDLVQEPLTGYSDAQVGAAARDVLRNCHSVLERMFALAPLAEQTEGVNIDVPAGFDPSAWRLVGKVVGEPPFTGTLVHPGWKATRCELPMWSGSAAAALVVAPAEVEIK